MTLDSKLLVLILSLVLIGAISSGKAVGQSLPDHLLVNQIRKCSPNSDRLYSRSDMLKRLAAILNNSTPEYAVIRLGGFRVESEKAVGFFVVDLTMPENNTTSPDGCVQFLGGHVYHVAPVRSRYSLSHIVFLEKGKLKVFRSVNCPERGDTIEQAVSYIGEKLARDANRDLIIERIRDYRKYGVYLTIDDSNSICKQE